MYVSVCVLTGQVEHAEMTLCVDDLAEAVEEKHRGREESEMPL